jgi:hypothetical protein
MVPARAEKVDIEVRYQPRKMTISKVCGLLWNCSDIMPWLMVDQLAECLPGFRERTYAVGARYAPMDIGKPTGSVT